VSILKMLILTAKSHGTGNRAVESDQKVTVNNYLYYRG